MMKKFDFVIGYDISSPKRLRKLAVLLAKVAIRIQYSLFLYPDVTKDDLNRVVEKILKIIDEKEDDVRIYRVNTLRSLNLMSGFDLTHPKNFL
jgi:CRISPR-associated endonuclease Cas2